MRAALSASPSRPPVKRRLLVQPDEQRYAKQYSIEMKQRNADIPGLTWSRRHDLENPLRGVFGTDEVALTIPKGF
jgi:hypothetical protein